MKSEDAQLGKPALCYVGLQADIEANFTTPGMRAFATDRAAGDGEYGYRNATEWVWGAGATSLHALTDVNDAGKSDGDSLVYNLATDKWIPSAIVGGGGGDGALWVINENHSASCNGVTVTFSTSQNFLTGKTLVYLNGMLQLEGAGNDYTEEAGLDGITFATAPLTGDHLLISYMVAFNDNAIHDNVAGEISAITEKVTPVGTDMLLIEDSEDSNAKKMVQIDNLPGGTGGADILEIQVFG